ncbi:MAG: hypothetical protein ACTHJL_10340 [Amnibacterium sp.]
MSASRRQRLKPVELVVMAAIVAVFVGVVVLLSTREIELASIFLGVAFIATLLLLAMFALVEGPDRPADPSETPVLMQERPPRRKDRR